MMKDLTNNPGEFKDPTALKHASPGVFHEWPGNNSNDSLSFQAQKNAASLNRFTETQIHNFRSKSNPEGLFAFDSSLVYKVNFGYIAKFFILMHRKFKAELDFHQTHAQEISSLLPDSTPAAPPLQAIKHMIYFDCFIIINKKENPIFMKIESIVKRFRLMTDLLKQAETSISTEDASRYIFFKNETECQKSIVKILPPSLFQNEYFSKICSELWRLIRKSPYHEPSEPLIQTPFENLKLFVYGISLPTSLYEDFPLHEAVYTSNLPMIRRICARENSPVFYSNVQQADPAGVTPLMLAVLLGNKDAALILTNHGADPKHRAYPYARTPLEEAIERKKRGVIKVLLRANNIIKQVQWEENKPTLMELLKKLPDFSFEMGWECDSKIIPFVKKVAPSDTYKIHKLGSMLRIDLSLLGWSKLQSIRGNSSIIFNGFGNEDGGRLMMVNHDKGLSADLFEDACGLNLESKTEDLIKQDRMKSELKAENVVFKPALTWKGEVITQNLDGYLTTKYNAKGTFSVLYTRRNILVDFDINKFTDFHEYFDSAIKDPLWSESNGVIGQGPIAKVISYIQSYQEILKGLQDKDDPSPNNNKREAANMNNIAQKRLMKNSTKNIVATVYMCENFPLSINHLMPVLEILSNVSPHINKVKSFLETQSNLNKRTFPLKASIPIMLSVNAILSMKNFKFTAPNKSLFDYEKLLKPQKIETQKDGKSPKKKLEDLIKEEKLRTEGPSEDEKQAQRCWEDLLKNSEEEDLIPYDVIGARRDNKYSNGELDDSMERTNTKINSFSRNRDSILGNESKNSGYVKPAEGENLEDCEISEKYCDETLRLYSHPTSLAKTITSIEEKFNRPRDDSNMMNSLIMNITEDKKMIRTINNIQIKPKYKFIETLNHHGLDEDLKENSGRSSRERICENNIRDLHMKKMLRYKAKGDQYSSNNNDEKTMCEYTDDDQQISPTTVDKNHLEGRRKIEQVVNQNLKYQRIKSMDTQQPKKSNSFFLAPQNNSGWKVQF